MTVRAVIILFVLSLTLASCGLEDGDAPGASAGRDQPTGQVTVLAAASLTDVFSEIGALLEKAHPGLRVRFSFGPSSGLAEQIVAGAPADVFATANAETMKAVVDAGGTAREPVVFARNTLQIAVPADNPAGVRTLADFARPDLRIALCAPEVPCGSAAGAVFDAAGMRPRADTLETDVKSTLAKVVLGEVDAALVYRTDVRAAGEKVEGIDFPQAGGAVNDYPIAPLAEAPNPPAAQAFVEAVFSDEGRALLAAAGFAVP